MSGHEECADIYKCCTYLTNNNLITIVHVNNNVTFVNNKVDCKGTNHNISFISCLSDNVCNMKEVYGKYENGNVSLINIQKHNIEKGILTNSNIFERNTNICHSEDENDSIFMKL